VLTRLGSERIIMKIIGGEHFTEQVMEFVNIQDVIIVNVYIKEMETQRQCLNA